MAATDLVADDLSLHGHAEAGERAAADLAGGDGLAASRLHQLVGLGLTAVQRLSREEADVAVAARDDGQQLLLKQQVDVMHLLVVSHTDNFWGGGHDDTVSTATEPISIISNVSICQSSG